MKSAGTGNSENLKVRVSALYVRFEIMERDVSDDTPGFSESPVCGQRIGVTGEFCVETVDCKNCEVTTTRGVSNVHWRVGTGRTVADWKYERA